MKLALEGAGGGGREGGREAEVYVGDRQTGRGRLEGGAGGHWGGGAGCTLEYVE